MESSGFYVQLPSNASMDLYPNNKLCCYKTQLPRTLHFDGKYEVGLVEMQYPNSWRTFHEENSYKVTIQHVPDFIDVRRVAFATVVLPREQYTTITELLTKVQEEVNKTARNNH